MQKQAVPQIADGLFVELGIAPCINTMFVWQPITNIRLCNRRFANIS